MELKERRKLRLDFKKEADFRDFFFYRGDGSIFFRLRKVTLGGKKSQILKMQAKGV